MYPIYQSLSLIIYSVFSIPTPIILICLVHVAQLSYDLPHLISSIIKASPTLKSLTHEDSPAHPIWDCMIGRTHSPMWDKWDCPKESHVYHHTTQSYVSVLQSHVGL